MSDEQIRNTRERFTRSLTDAIGTQNVDDVARQAGLDGDVLLQLLSGARIPDLGDIAALEHVLNADLWPELPN